MLTVLSLFSLSLFIITLYLGLLHYTRLFKHTTLSTEFLLNLNFYLLLLYLLCFVISIFCLVSEYSFKLAGEALANVIMSEMSGTLVSGETNIETKCVDIQNSKQITDSENA